MASPEEIPNNEPLPLTPRADDGVETADGDVPVARKKRVHTPARAKVEFWHQGEQPVQMEKKSFARRVDHARRSDHLSFLMAIFAIVLIVVVVVALYINNKKYSIESGESSKTVAPVVNFYQGNHAYLRKVQEAKAGLSIQDLPVQGADEDLGVSLRSQSLSMDEKLQKMRSEKSMEEPPPPPTDLGARPVPVIGIRATDAQKFNSPLEFNGMVPTSLKGTNQ